MGGRQEILGSVGTKTLLTWLLAIAGSLLLLLPCLVWFFFLVEKGILRTSRKESASPGCLFFREAHNHSPLLVVLSGLPSGVRGAPVRSWEKSAYMGCLWLLDWRLGKVGSG